MKPNIFFFFLCFAITNLLASCNIVENDSSQNITETIAVNRKDSLFKKAAIAFAYCRKNKMDTTICLLADMKIHSGNFRFFVWNFQTKAIIDSGMLSHGCGKNPWSNTKSKDNPTFSNIDGSHLSSLGKYKILQRNYSDWGIHVNYSLKGLESTNNNAQKRTIVLHSWEDVPETEIYPNGTPEGWGCPAINNGFMKRLDKLLQNAKQPVLLWQFYD